jgi:hypothetical protein
MPYSILLSLGVAAVPPLSVPKTLQSCMSEAISSEYKNALLITVKYIYSNSLLPHRTHHNNPNIKSIFFSSSSF